MELERRGHRGSDSLASLLFEITDVVDHGGVEGLLASSAEEGRVFNRIGLDILEHCPRDRLDDELLSATWRHFEMQQRLLFLANTGHVAFLLRCELRTRCRIEIAEAQIRLHLCDVEDLSRRSAWRS